MNSVISFFVACCFAIAFANGVSVSNESSNDFDEEIKAKLDEATMLDQHQQQVEVSGRGLIGSILVNLGISVKTLLVQVLAGILTALPFLNDVIAGALKGASNGSKDGVVNGLIGTVGGLAGGITTGFQTTITRAVISGFEGSDPETNELFEKYFHEALGLALDKRDAQNERDRSATAAALNNISDLVKLALNLVLGLVPYLRTVLESTLNGLFEGLPEEIHRNGLIGGLLDGVAKGVEGLPRGVSSGTGHFIYGLLSAPK